MRKETMDTIAIALMLVLITLVTVLCKNFENNYSINGKVYKITGDEITFEDVTGQTWKWEKEEGKKYTVGQEVKLFFNDNNTDVRYDDILKKIKFRD